MHEQDPNQKRMLTAAILCLLLAAAWQMVFPPPKRPLKPKTPSAVATSSSSTAQTSSSAIAAAKTSSSAAPARILAKPELFEFKGSVALDSRQIPFEISLSNVGGGIERFLLPSYKERNKDNEATDEPISLANPMADEPTGKLTYGQMAGIAFTDETSFEVPRRLVYQVVEKTENSVRYRYTTDDNIVIEREYQLSKDSFAVEMAVTIQNNSSKSHKHQLQMNAALRATDAMKKGGGFFSNFIPPPDHLEGLCYSDGSVKRENYLSLQKETEKYDEAVRWVAADRQYFVAAILSRDRSEPKCVLEAKKETTRAGLIMPTIELKPGEQHRHKFTAYLGVKKPGILSQTDPELSGAVNYTIMGLNLAPFCTVLLWILRFIFQLTGSWGVAIIGLTVLVKLILFPVNQKQGKSMRMMSALKPQMDAIKEKFPDDRQRQSEETMRLYREHKVNPMAGCFPMLLQMPIWFALYRSLWVSVDLYQEKFLWVADLTTRDPYWILPIVLVLAMFLQQKLMPTTMDPAQQKIMMYTMPLMFGTMMSQLPAGLCFYILVNTLLTIVQQHLINRMYGPPTGAKPSAPEASA